MDFKAVIYVLAGSTFGLILRLFIKNNIKKDIGFDFNNISMINTLASLFLGIFVAIDPLNKYLSFLFYVGFLGCFSTFSSFIYQLFDFIQHRQYLRLLFYYIKVLVLSFLFFYIGYCISSMLNN